MSMPVRPTFRSGTPRGKNSVQQKEDEFDDWIDKQYESATGKQASRPQPSHQYDDDDDDPYGFDEPQVPTSTVGSKPFGKSGAGGMGKNPGRDFEDFEGAVRGSNYGGFEADLRTAQKRESDNFVAAQRGAVAASKPVVKQAPAPQPEEDDEYGDDGYGDDDFEDYEDEFDEDEDEEEEEEEPAPAPVKPRPAPAPPSGMASIRSNQDPYSDEDRQATNRAPTKPTLNRGAAPTPTSAPAPVRSEDPYGQADADPYGSVPRTKAPEGTGGNRPQKIQDARLIRRRIDRGRALVKVINLTEASFEVFDLQPLTQYELYTRQVSSGKTQSVFTSTSDNNAAMGVQTEPVEAANATQQAPEDQMWTVSTAVGRDSVEKQEKSGDNEEEVDDGREIESIALMNFLQRTSGVAEVLLTENVQGDSYRGAVRLQSDIAPNCLHMAFPSNHGISQRPVVDVSFSPPPQSNMMVSVCGQSPHGGSEQGILCVWDLNEPEKPKRLLVTEGEVTCATFAPDNPFIIIAGTAAGSLSMWDLREPDSLHKNPDGTQDEKAMRRPTYSTDWITADNHSSPVVQVAGVPSGETGVNVGGANFQVMSVDDSGVAIVWTISQLKASDFGGSADDLGLRPGGKVKIMKSTSVAAVAGSIGSIGRLAFGIELRGGDTTSFLVPADGGRVMHCSRGGGMCVPRSYVRPGFMGNVTSVSSSPFLSQYFLAGYDDGAVALFDGDKAEPSVVLDRFSDDAIRSVQWSTSRPSVFFCCDAKSNLHLWDLLRNDKEPIVTERHPNRSGTSHAHITSVALSTEKGYREPAISLAYDSGDVDVLLLHDDWSKGPVDEMKQFKELVRYL